MRRGYSIVSQAKVWTHTIGGDTDVYSIRSTKYLVRHEQELPKTGLRGCRELPSKFYQAKDVAIPELITDVLELRVRLVEYSKSISRMES